MIRSAKPATVSQNQPQLATDGYWGLVTGAVDIVSTAPGRGLGFEEEQERGNESFSFPQHDNPSQFHIVGNLSPSYSLRGFTLSSLRYLRFIEIAFSSFEPSG